MDIGSIFLILGLLILVGLFVSRPFLEGKATALSREEQDFSSLLAERDRILTALQELDFDYALGKIPEEDYPPMRAGLMQEGADVLRRLDTYAGEAPESAVEDRIEAAVAARRADARQLSSTAASGNNHGVRGAAGVAEAEDDLEVQLANRRRLRNEKSAGFCPKCGGPVQKSDRFCPKCGATLS